MPAPSIAWSSDAWDFDHDGFPNGKLFNGEHEIGSKFNVLCKCSVNLHSNSVQVFALQEITALTIETFTASHRGACGGTLTFFESGNCGTQLNDAARKFVTGCERESRSEFAFVDMEICSADAASVNTQKNLVGLDFGDINIAVFEFARGVVNNGFHNGFAFNERRFGEGVRGWV